MFVTLRRLPPALNCRATPGLDFPRLLASFAAILAALVLSGCVVGRTYDFNLPPSGGESVGQDRPMILFAVADERPDVVSGDEPPTWVGEQRSGWGIPYTVKTASGRTMAEVVRDVIRAELGSRDFDVREVRQVGPATPGAVEAFLAKHDADRGIAVTMNRLDSDTYTDIDVEWDLEIEVYGPDGRVLARDRVQGQRELEGSWLDPVGAANRAVPEFLYRHLIPRLVTENEEIMQALLSDRTEAEAVPEDLNDCTVEQVLKMKEAGLSDAQIRAACGSQG